MAKIERITDILAKLERNLEILHENGSCFEVRIPKAGRSGTVAGWFDDPAKAAQAAKRWDGKANIYVTLNPVNPALLARAENRLKERMDSTTADALIIKRRWLLVDCDPVRPVGISATDREKGAAWERCEALREWLAEHGLPAPVVADSGNGFHLLYRVDLPNDTESHDLVKRCLEALAYRFDDERVTVDTSVFNAARIIKLYGTLSVKGDDTRERPHRRSSLEAVPQGLGAVGVSLLHDLAALAPKPQTKMPAQRGQFALQDFISRGNLQVARVRPWQGGILHELEVCPFDPEHKRTSRIIEFTNGGLAFGCFHNSCQGRDWHALRELVEPGAKSLKPKGRNRTKKYEPPDATLPEIVVTDRHLRDITTDTLEALYKANKPERIFRRNNTLTRIRLDENQRPYTEALGESAFRGCLARSCNFVRVMAKSDRVATPPPLDVVRDCLSLGEWQFPALLGVTEAPVIRPDGTVITRAGYDSTTNLYYYPSPKLTVPPIPHRPGDSDIKTATELILEPLADFPFDTEASRANAIATLFTPILRPIMDGPVPMALFDKPQQGTGASLMAEVISLIATGRAAAMMTAPKDDEGWRKAITSLLLKGQLVATIDNIEHDLWAPSLAAVLTSINWQDRILGRSEMVTLPHRTTWLATGNNIRLRGDLPRRCIWVRMDARMARPWLRDPGSFRHPNLLEWVSDKRGAILAAILTVARAWVVAGMPKPQGLPNLGGYESYCGVVGGVLAYMGIDGFLTNLDIMYSEMDKETPQWEAFLEAWFEFVGEDSVTVAEVIKLLDDNGDFRALLPDSLAGRDTRDYSRRLGNALSRHNGVRYPNGLMVNKTGKRKHAITWQVVSYGVSYESQGPESKLALTGELGELATTPALMQKRNSYRGGAGVDSPNSPLATKKGELTHPDIPDYPTGPCGACGCDRFWRTNWGKWLCQRCHPKPGGDDEKP